jgi:hypothetical protein
MKHDLSINLIADRAWFRPVRREMSFISSATATNSLVGLKAASALPALIPFYNTVFSVFLQAFSPDSVAVS